MNKNIIFLKLLFISLIIVTSACNKGEPPELLPESTFILPNIEADTTENKNYSNVFYASTNVLEWTSILTIDLATPTNAFIETYNHTPKYVKKNTWVWEYSITNLLATYNIQLYGILQDDGSINWEMHISQEGVYDDFTWFTGYENPERTSGYWILYKSPDENHELLKIEWTRNLDDNTGTLKYTNIEPGSEENGGYIFYGNDQDGEYDAFYDIYNKGKDNLTEIDLNTEYKNGRIKDYAIFSDSLWHCWDTNLLDCDCDVTAK